MIKLIRIKTYILVYIPFFILFYRDVKERDHGYYSCRQNTDKANIQTFPLIVQGKIFSSGENYDQIFFAFRNFSLTFRRLLVSTFKITIFRREWGSN